MNAILHAQTRLKLVLDSLETFVPLLSIAKTFTMTSNDVVIFLTLKRVSRDRKDLFFT